MPCILRLNEDFLRHLHFGKASASEPYLHVLIYRDVPKQALEEVSEWRVSFWNLGRRVESRLGDRLDGDVDSQNNMRTPIQVQVRNWYAQD